ncbi:response regulator [Thalassotalea sp. M1531]|uniref:Response regulator n=1 Tax=Thalassotalea algicola TaxID=2716224 RepID=A0A7Y0Q9N3_9GAMM|nr:response regulator [Thalassotalea algicola]NMP33380.1 response regulator [Thalassotalea algicola]
MNILVVDDKASIIEHLDGLLTKRGCRVTTASNGLDGYEKYQNASFDLLVIDHLMPLMNGIQLLKNIKQHENTHTPIIFMTTQGKDSVAELIEQQLCDFVIDKPIDEQNFLSLIEQLNKQNTRFASL